MYVTRILLPINNMIFIYTPEYVRTAEMGLEKETKEKKKTVRCAMAHCN